MTSSIRFILVWGKNCGMSIFERFLKCVQNFHCYDAYLKFHKITSFLEKAEMTKLNKALLEPLLGHVWYKILTTIEDGNGVCFSCGGITPWTTLSKLFTRISSYIYIVEFLGKD